MSDIEKSVSFSQCQAFARKLESQYIQTACASPSFRLSFGEWVMQTYYPDAPDHPNIRDMCTTFRTSDAYIWLIANLQTGILPLPATNQAA